MNPCILFRASRETEEERDIAKRFFPVYESRAAIPKGSYVIPRYAALPYFGELVADLAYQNSVVINTLRQHRFVADITNYVDILRNGEERPFKGLTPPAWTRLQDTSWSGAFVLKGTCNSRKDRWSTHAYASGRKEAAQVYERLLMDSFIEEQGIVLRPYWPLHLHLQGVNGQPIVDEYRVFFCMGKELVRGFYWANYLEEIPASQRDPGSIPQGLLDTLVERVGSRCTFWVADVARREDGSWCCIELNDGQQSGLSDCSATDLYRTLRESVDAFLTSLRTPPTLEEFNPRQPRSGAMT